jgi:hypothetical protein
MTDLEWRDVGYDRFRVAGCRIKQIKVEMLKVEMFKT